MKNLLKNKIIALSLVSTLSLFQFGCDSTTANNSKNAGGGGGGGETPTAEETAATTAVQMMNIASAILTSLESSSSSVNLDESDSSSSVVGCIQACDQAYIFQASAGTSGSTISTFETSDSCNYSNDAVDVGDGETMTLNGTASGSCVYSFSPELGLLVNCDQYSNNSSAGSFTGDLTGNAVSESSQLINMAGTYNFADETSCTVGLRIVSGSASEDQTCLFETTDESLQEDFASDSCDGDSTLNYTQAHAALTEGEASSAQILCTMRHASCISENVGCFNASDLVAGLNACGGDAE